MIQVATSHDSLGIARYSQRLAEGYRNAGFDAVVTDQPRWRTSAHFHLGNSTRSLLPRIRMARRPSLVTVHDVVPRSAWLRSGWPALAQRILAGHHLVAHSEYAANMLREIGLVGPTEVIPLASDVKRLPDEERDRQRCVLAPGGGPIVVLAGVLKEAKGSLEVLAAAQGIRDLTFVLAGSAADAATSRLLAESGTNVVHLPGLDDAQFEATIAAADALLVFRRDWVGEASAPVGLAHGFGTPVIGFDLGGLAEYCGPEDRLFPASATVAEALAKVRGELHGGLTRLGRDASQVTTWEQSTARHIEIVQRLGLDT